MKIIEFIILIFLIGFLWIILKKKNKNNKIKESFNSTNCNPIYSKNGMICQIVPSPLIPTKCFRVRKTKEQPFGYFETVGNDVDCSLYGLYPNCQDVSEACNAPNIYKLGDGYVDLYP